MIAGNLLKEWLMEDFLALACIAALLLCVVVV